MTDNRDLAALLRLLQATTTPEILDCVADDLVTVARAADQLRWSSTRRYDQAAAPSLVKALAALEARLREVLPP